MRCKYAKTLMSLALVLAAMATLAASRHQDEWDYESVDVEDEEGDEEEEEDGEEAWEEEEARLEEEAAARALSELPLSRLLALEREVRRAAVPTRNNLSVDGVTPWSGWSQQNQETHDSDSDGDDDASDASGPAALRLLAPRPSPPRGPGPMRRGDRGDRGGPPPWDDEEVLVEVEEEPPWMPAMQQKSKSKIISKIFQGSVTALAFLAFGGYLLCLIVQAVKNKQQMQMMTMVSATPAPPVNLQRPVFVSGRRRRRRHVLSPEPQDALTRALFLLADGYALYSGFYVPRGPSRSHSFL